MALLLGVVPCLREESQSLAKRLTNAYCESWPYLKMYSLQILRILTNVVQCSGALHIPWQC